MAFQPKTEHGSSPRSISTTDKKSYDEMSISELVSVLRVAFQMKDFDEVEEELVNREAKLRAEIGSLREKIEIERLNSTEAEQRLKMREEQCEKGKRAQENYEQLLKEVKKSGLVENITIEELRTKNVALESEICELKEFKKKMIEDGKSVAELRAKIRVLEEEKVGDKSALDSLNMKNIELEEAVKKNLTVIEGLRTENGKLTDEKHELKTLFESLERRYSELRVSDVKLEENIMPLMSEDDSDCGNTEVELNLAVSYAVKDEKDVGDHELENDTGEPVSFHRNEDTHYSVDAGTVQSPKKGNKCEAEVALGVKFKLEKEIIDLGGDDDDDDDDDDDRCTSQGLHREKANSQIIAENEHLKRVEMIKRKRASDIQTSTSTSISSADLFEIDNRPAKRNMVDDQTPISSNHPSGRSTRGPTRLRRLLLRGARGVKTPVIIDVNTGVASGPNADMFNSYLGVVAREKISILIPLWDHVPEVDRTMIWEDILTYFDIPNVQSLRSKVLSSVANKFRSFKLLLTTKYVFGSYKGQNPGLKYSNIDEKTWRLFVESRESEQWTGIRKKAQNIAYQNVTPHLLSRAGYRKLEQSLVNEKKKSRQMTTFENDTGVNEPPSPPTRHQKWKMARMRKSGTYSSEQSRIISEKIDSLVEQSTQGSFVPYGRQDILHEAIGRLEHCGHVRAAGKGVGILQFFGVAPRNSSFT